MLNSASAEDENFQITKHNKTLKEITKDGSNQILKTPFTKQQDGENTTSSVLQSTKRGLLKDITSQTNTALRQINSAQRKDTNDSPQLRSFGMTSDLYQKLSKSRLDMSLEADEEAIIKANDTKTLIDQGVCTDSESEVEDDFFLQPIEYAPTYEDEDQNKEHKNVQSVDLALESMIAEARGIYLSPHLPIIEHLETIAEELDQLDVKKNDSITSFVEIIPFPEVLNEDEKGPDGH